MYNFLLDFPPCNTTEELQCIFRSFKYSRKDRYKCLNLKKNVQYKSNFIFNAARESSDSGFRLKIYFDKDTKDVKEEIMMVPIEDFIGSIGGSLGLFLGFSCYTYMSQMLDKLLP